MITKKRCTENATEKRQHQQQIQPTTNDIESSSTVNCFLSVDNWRNYFREFFVNEGRSIHTQCGANKNIAEGRQFFNAITAMNCKLSSSKVTAIKRTSINLTINEIEPRPKTATDTETDTEAESETEIETKIKMQRNHLQMNEMQMKPFDKYANRANNALTQSSMPPTTTTIPKTTTTATEITSAALSTMKRNPSKSSLSSSSTTQRSSQSPKAHPQQAQHTALFQSPATLSTSLATSSSTLMATSSSSPSSTPLRSPATITKTRRKTHNNNSKNNSSTPTTTAAASNATTSSTTITATISTNTNNNSYSAFTTKAFPTSIPRKLLNAAISTPAPACIWLLPIFCLVAMLGSGQAGFACLSNPCVFGVCIDGLNSSYSCYCIDGYTGIQCQTNWDECWSGPCQNGGTCVDGVAYYNCTCPDGFSGPNCEENVDECMSNPCQNGGHCRDRNNGYTCTCQAGYLGTHCEVDVAVCETGTGARCQNGGECIEGPGLEFSCACTPGWKGRICQEEINECESAPCQNGGVCVDKLAAYACACPMGYTGTNCEEEILICADNPCQNNALCLMEENIPTCYCVPDYHGEKCEYQYDECQLGPRCMNGGVCIDGVDTFSCSCPPLLTGMLCECLMIGEDSLDCNYTAPSTMAPPPVSVRPIVPTETTQRAEPAVTTTQATETSEGISGEGGVSKPKPGSSEESEVTKSKPDTSIEGGEVGTTMPSRTSPGLSSEGGVSLVTTAHPFPTTIGTSGAVSEESGGSSVIVDSSEYTTIDLPSRGHETTTTLRPTKSIIFGEDYTPTSSSQSKDWTSSESGEIIPGIRHTTQRPPYTHITTISEGGSTFDYSTPRPSWSVPTTSLPTSSISVESSEERPHTTFAPSPTSPPSYPPLPTKQPDDSNEIYPTMPPRGWPEITTTPAAPFFTEYPQTHVTTQRIPSRTTSTVDVTTVVPVTTTEPGITYHPAITHRDGLLPATTKSTGEQPAHTTWRTPHDIFTTHRYEYPETTLQPSGGTHYPTPPIIELTTTHPIYTDDLVSHLPPEVATTEMPQLPAVTTALPPEEPTVITHAPAPMTTQQIPIQPTTIQATTLPPQHPISPVYTTHTPVITTGRPVAGDSSEEGGESANTVAPAVITTTPSTATDNSSYVDCLKTGCFNGGTCVTTSEGSRCVCRFDRQGALCELPIIIKNAAFSGDSYVSHRIHKDIPNHESLDSVLPMHVQLKVRTRATNGLIMLAAAQGTKGGHYMALFLQKGLLQFQFSCGLQTMLLSELETPVNTGHEITIRAELDFSRNYTHCNASLLVNDTLAMSGDQPTWLKLLPVRLHTPDVILNTWLHLGGAPQAPIGLIIELPPAQSGTGFTGCLHSLRINDENREIFGDALDGFGITECGSLACLSSPCRNGAACIKIETNEVDENGEKIEKWKCKCPSGYMGPTCEISVCEDNPCQYGGTCVQFPGSGYLCLCPLGKHGHYCEHNLEVALPSFSGSVNGLSSFVAYTVPIPLEYSIELSFKILPQTMSQIALLAFLGQSGFHDEKSDHLAISFIQGYIMLTWNLGGGPRRIFTQKPIDFRLDAPRVPYEIKVGRIGRQAWLSVDGKFNITGRSPGSVNRMDVMPILYLGGHEIANFNTLPHDLPLHSGFQGCIYDVHLKAGQVTVPLQETRGVRGRGVGQCGTRECHRHACQHDGACLQHGATFTCICQEGWYGPLCAQPKNPCDSFNNKCSDDSTCVPLVNGYECDCPVGKTGKNCEEEIRSLSDVSLTGRRSYLAVTWPYLYDKTDKLGSKRSQIVTYRNFTKKLMPPKPVSSPSQHFVMKLLNEVEKQRNFSPVPLMGSKSFEEHHRVQFFFIEFQLRPLSERGLLLYFGTLNNNQDKKVGFVSLSLQGGVVEFRISGPSNHVTVVRSVRMLAIGEWHKIKMAQRGRWLTLWVEGSASSALAPSAEVLVEPDSLLYIGGLKDLSKLPYNAISGFPIPFRGCVRGLVVSGTRIVLNETNIVESRNIRDCDGTACGGDSCESGGHCWLDEKLQPHCICPEYAKGERCEYSETCKLIPCRNNGRCLRSGRCSCPNGWGGFYCEIAMSKPTTPSFRGNSYLILPPPRIPMKDKRKGPSMYMRPREAMQISLNFSTIEPDGLLLWSEHDRAKFLGLGLENGHLKIASNLLGTNNDTVAAPSSGYIADGGWHLAKVLLDRARLELQLDGEVIFTEKLGESNLLSATAATAAAAAATTLATTTTTQTASQQFAMRRTAQRSSLTPTTLTARRSPLKDAVSITYEDVFFLGGFPDMESVSRRTQGRFDAPFKGCLQDIQFGAEPKAIINDFSPYQGENIGSCDLHGDEPLMIVV